MLTCCCECRKSSVWVGIEEVWIVTGKQFGTTPRRPIIIVYFFSLVLFNGYKRTSKYILKKWSAFQVIHLFSTSTGKTIKTNHKINAITCMKQFQYSHNYFITHKQSVETIMINFGKFISFSTLCYPPNIPNLGGIVLLKKTKTKCFFESSQRINSYECLFITVCLLFYSSLFYSITITVQLRYIIC